MYVKTICGLVATSIYLSTLGNIVFVESKNIDTRPFLNSSSGGLRFIAVGDWGADRSRQNEVADSMGYWCDIHGCDFIISMGDNFYDDGVTSANSHRFQSTWEDVYTHPSIKDLTWYITTGNHDHHGDDGREWYQVEHSGIDSRWYFPDLAYSFSHTADSSSVKFVVIDTESIRHNKNNPDEMIHFLEEELNDHSVDWKFVIGHHPCYSAGHHAGSETIRSRVLPLMKEYEVDIYLAGHDHNQEHWQDNTPDVDHVVTGSGGKSNYGMDQDTYEEMIRLGVQLKTFKEDYGFAYVVVHDEYIYLRFLNNYGDVIYEYYRYK